MIVYSGNINNMRPTGATRGRINCGSTILITVNKSTNKTNYKRPQWCCAFVWAYLSKRKQRVKLSGRASDWMELLKGVPQGSILGPIFFNIFMNDIYATITRSSLYNYADDNTIAVICDTKQDAIDALSQESELALNFGLDPVNLDMVRCLKT